MNYKELNLSKEQFKELVETKNFLALRHILIRILIEVLLIFILFTVISIGSYLSLAISLFLILALGFYHSFWGYAGIGHELFHARVFSNKAVNKLLFCFASAITYNNRAFFKYTHFKHHGKTFEDEDLEVSIQPFSRFAILRYVLVDYVLMFRRLKYVLNNFVGIVPLGFEAIKKEVRCAAAEIITINFLVYSSIYVTTASIFVVVAFFLSQFSCSFFNKVLAQSQHLGLQSKKKNGPLHHSRTIKLPSWLAFLYANMNFHREHHLLPAVPYYNLPRLNAMLFDSGLVKKDVGVQYLLHQFWDEVRAEII